MPAIKPKHYSIYVVLNTATKRVYVGQTINSVKSRWNGHISESKTRKRSIPLHAAIRKYGRDKFEIFTIMESDCRKELSKLEAIAIRHFQSLAPKGYNIEPGGYVGPVAESTRNKMSKAKHGKKRGPMPKSTRIKIGKAHLGKKPTWEWTEEMKSAARSRMAHRNKKSNPMDNPETRAKMASTKRGKNKSDEFKRKMSALFSGENNPFFGKKHTEETKKRIRSNRKDPRTNPNYSANLSKAITAWWKTRKEIKHASAIRS